MKQIKRLKREKVSLFLTAAVLSLGILSGCGAESKEAKEARMTTSAMNIRNSTFTSGFPVSIFP